MLGSLAGDRLLLVVVGVSAADLIGLDEKVSQHQADLLVIGALCLFLQIKGIEIDSIENALRILSTKEKEIIETKHFTDDTWETVSYIAKKSIKQCKRIEVDALKKMYEILNY